MPRARSLVRRRAPALAACAAALGWLLWPLAAGASPDEPWRRETATPTAALRSTTIALSIRYF